MKKQKWFFSLPLVAGAVAAPLSVVACNDTKEKDKEINKLLKAEKEQLTNEKATKEAELAQVNSDKAALLAEKEQLIKEKTAKEAELANANKEKDEANSQKAAKEAELTQANSDKAALLAEKEQLTNEKAAKEAELKELNAKITALENIIQYQKEQNLKLKDEKELKLAEGVTEEKINAIEKVEGIEAIVDKIEKTAGDSIEAKIKKFIEDNKYSEEEKASELSTSIFLDSLKYKDNEKVQKANLDFSKLDSADLNVVLKFAVDLVNAAK
ncbi:hypothetical protein ACM0IS_02660 [Mycoplasma aquilae ATCC BAA-1896]|uniref:hypothetical protein n=1 Tax=Mycoplasma aquilae TaxID=1312741 RepID=UPI003A8722FD